MRLGRRGYLLAEVLVCTAAAAMVCVSAVAAYSSGIKLLEHAKKAKTGFEAAAGAYDEAELQELGLTLAKEEFYCEGLQKPFYYVTVKSRDGKIIGGLVSGCE